MGNFDPESDRVASRALDEPVEDAAAGDIPGRPAPADPGPLDTSSKANQVRPLRGPFAAA